MKTKKKTIERAPTYIELLPKRRPSTDAERQNPASDDGSDPLFETLKEIAAKKKGGEQ
jgi:hypothetical protein